MLFIIKRMLLVIIILSTLIVVATNIQPSKQSKYLPNKLDSITNNLKHPDTVYISKDRNTLYIRHHKLYYRIKL